jgi:ADP-heptose:LPS heptosyltransferase
VVHGPERVAASRRLAGLRRPLVGLHVGARDPARRWPVAHALATAQAVAEGGTVVALGDLPLPAPQRTAGVVDLGGRLRLAVLAAVIERLDVLLTTDSGPAHLAYALGTPSVTVGLPVDAVRYAPPADGPHARLDVAASRSATGDGGLAVDDALDRCVLVAAERVRSAGRRTSGA